MGDHPLPPTEIFPELRGWRLMGMHDAVFLAKAPNEGTVYVRADDGSALLLDRLAELPDVPAPEVLDKRTGWLLLEALPGTPLHDDSWLVRGREAAEVIADALMRLARNELRHGDMCVPNILGDLTTGRLSGIVDWRYAGQYERQIDVASAVWSCGYNGHQAQVAEDVLRGIRWPRTDAAEVRRLERIWIELAGLADPPGDQPC